MKRMIPPVVVALSTVICAAQSEGAKTLVLEKNEGEARVRRPLGSLPIPTAEFILKVTPQNSGSKHLVLGTEDIPPGGEIPRHKHLSKTRSCWSRRAPHTSLWAPRNTMYMPEHGFLSGSDLGKPQKHRYRQHQPGLYLLRPRFRREHAVRIGARRAVCSTHQHRRTQGLRS
jgi:hypothetical protein